MKRLLIFLFILSLTRLGVAYATEQPDGSLQNFFLGTNYLNAPNVNQVLALLVGPAGPPGPAGVAGRDGFSGINGVDGLPGAPGPAGEQGPQGVPGPAGEQGPQGVAGPQGATGATGATGAQGPQGVAGPQGLPGTSGGVLGLTGGSVQLRGCATRIDVKIDRKFDGGNFYVKSITVANIPTGCIGQFLFLYLTNSLGSYVYKCPITSTSNIVLNNESCETIERGSGPFFYQAGTPPQGTRMNDSVFADGAIGVEIAQ